MVEFGGGEQSRGRQHGTYVGGVLFAHARVREDEEDAPLETRALCRVRLYVGAAGLDFDEDVLLATRSMEVDGLAAADRVLLGDREAPLAQPVGDDGLPVLVL